MKNYFILLTVIFSFQTCVMASGSYYVQKYYPNYASRRYYYPNSTINKTHYNNNQIHRNDFINSNNRIKRFQRTKRIQRLRNAYNQLGWLDKNNQGTLTGYSVPVTRDVFNQIGIPKYNINDKIYTRPTYTRELYSTPTGDEIYYQNGNKYINDGGISAKTGVTIIYD